MSSTAMPGQLLVAHRKRERELAVGPLLRPHAEVDEVVPVERRQQERRRHAGVGEDVVGVALRVEVRHLVALHQRRHAVVGERHPLARVLERGPDDVRHAARLGGGGHRPRLRHLPLRREVLPEVRDAVRAVARPRTPARTDSASSRSQATTSAPRPASSCAFSESGLRVSARAAKPPLGSARIARTSPPPCAPVAPTTAMIFLSAMESLLGPLDRLCRPLRRRGHPLSSRPAGASRASRAASHDGARAPHLRPLLARDGRAHDVGADVADRLGRKAADRAADERMPRTTRRRGRARGSRGSSRRRRSARRRCRSSRRRRRCARGRRAGRAAAGCSGVRSIGPRPVVRDRHVRERRDSSGGDRPPPSARAARCGRSPAPMRPPSAIPQPPLPNATRPPRVTW